MPAAELTTRKPYAQDAYRALVSAILAQAVSDARSDRQAWSDGGADVRCTRAAAIAYLRGCADLTALCELAGCDSEQVQSALLKAARLTK